MTDITTSITLASSIGTIMVAGSSIASTFTAYLLAEIECGILRAKLWQNDLTAIGIAVRTGLVDTDAALDHLAGCGALRLIAWSSAAITSPATSAST